MIERHTWRFPLRRTHAGMLMGNGLMGLMIWGEGGVLKVTVGRADFWDHRGGMEWTAEQSYANIRECLEQGDHPRLRRLFEGTAAAPGTPRSPSIIPLGHFELDWGPGAQLTEGTLTLRAGEVRVAVSGPDGASVVEFVMDMERPVAAIRWPQGRGPARLRPVPAYETIGERMRSIGIPEPHVAGGGDAPGWVQELPADGALAVTCRRSEDGLLLATARGGSPAEARASADALLADSSFDGVRKAARRWWRSYWRDVPRVELPNPTLQFLNDYGMYKYAGLTNPAGVAAGLQGPWIEDYQLPPWSADYHFDVNVQMCYWPGLRGNRPAHFAPLWDMVTSWTDRLRHNARMFAGVEDGLMLAVAVDDRCTQMGGWWPGAVDQSSTAWVAQMMFQHYAYTMDREFLRTTAWPFMLGAMRVYEAMLERDGDAFVLPVGVSPEYKGSSMDAWGRNATFQLAAIHRLLEDLMEAAAVLGEAPRPIWLEIQQKLPRATVAEWSVPKSAWIGVRGSPRTIQLWEGQPLEESHRHHSHLAGLYPFDVIDPADPQWAPIVGSTFNEWIFRGMGLWSGWCIPWAAILHGRVGNAETAEFLLEAFDRIYTNEGHGTRHDPNFCGFSLIGTPPFGRPAGGEHAELMQIEAGMGAAAAVQEMLMHTCRGVNHLFSGAPASWEHVSFDGMRTAGAFLVSASRSGGRVEEVRVRSEAGGVLRLANPWAGEARVERDGGRSTALGGRVLDIATEVGEEIRLSEGT